MKHWLDDLSTSLFKRSEVPPKGYVSAEEAFAHIESKGEKTSLRSVRRKLARFRAAGILDCVEVKRLVKGCLRPVKYYGPKKTK